jgi:hypothetical protein
VSTEESNQIGSLQKVDETSQMESNLPSQSKQESINESKRNSWGRTSVSLNGYSHNYVYQN